MRRCCKDGYDTYQNFGRHRAGDRLRPGWRAPLVLCVLLGGGGGEPAEAVAGEEALDEALL